MVTSSALPPDDPELVAARELGIPVRKRSQWLPEVTAGHDLVSGVRVGPTLRLAPRTAAVVREE